MCFKKFLQKYEKIVDLSETKYTHQGSIPLK